MKSELGAISVFDGSAGGSFGNPLQATCVAQGAWSWYTFLEVVCDNKVEAGVAERQTQGT
ncbi:MAG: hypothetical protein WAO51_10235 [Bacillota bacterium]